MTNMTTQHAVIRCDKLSIERPAPLNRNTLDRLLVLIHVIHDTFHIPSFNVAT